jgi:hypothetical protein
MVVIQFIHDAPFRSEVEAKPLEKPGPEAFTDRRSDRLAAVAAVRCKMSRLEKRSPK